jgi:hypothetical protein
MRPGPLLLNREQRRHHAFAGQRQVTQPCARRARDRVGGGGRPAGRLADPIRRGRKRTPA